MNGQPPHGGPPSLDREREMEEQHRLHLQQQDEMARREREQNERERQHREQYQSTPPHQNNTGTIPLHQPVASRVAGAIHSPSGILANHGASSQSGPLGAPEGPRNAFGPPLHMDGNRNAQQQYPGHPQQQHSIFPQNMGVNQHNNPQPLGLPGGFGGPLHENTRLQQQMPFTQGPGNAQMPVQPGAGQGQQPILHDALSYLDQVKVQFVEQPDVYNRFLDIMKDFKSQAIDTPGVINRVSELFAGNPNLIQGFNTFLPPGYRIECGGNNDPNTIRVTTPMGTTLQSINGTSRPVPVDPANGQGNASGPYYGSVLLRPPQQNIESPEIFSPTVQVQHPPVPYGQPLTQTTSYPQPPQQPISNRGRDGQAVVTLNAAATAAGLQRNVQTPTPGSQGAGSQQPGNEKRGPVEFNHAISYVNKIKNRFQDKPGIYKQFLEILQTYQRESKPIQDVYTQVTQLFKDAEDLLEDFKQFLPESAAAAEAAQNSQDAAALAGVAVASHGLHANKPEQKMPPVGNFAPPQSSTGKEVTKKRPRPPPAGENSRNSAGQLDNVRTNLAQGSGNKRLKTSNGKPAQVVSPAVSPTLTPAMPEPIPPTSTASVAPEEFAFFDRAKKFIGNKQTSNEFLKLCNLFSQDLIDKNVLVHKVSNFIGGNADLMEYFKNFIKWEGNNEVIENRPKMPSGRVSLSNCRGLGPSYRLLPKRERLRKCSGRDEMCHSVLNDEWASHPTWASEDSGFVAHRKNGFEEALHRIEEERHDYDFNIEANAKVIQLLEPIGNAIMNMSAQESQNYEFPRTFGENRSIYRRILKKVYGNEKGLQVSEDLFASPIEVVPVVLTRLKQKDEEWRFTQREWDKVWHNQTNIMYLKSLDHMGIQVKTADKKLFNPKHVVDLIKTKMEEQRRQRKSGDMKVAKHQLSYVFEDDDVMMDAVRLLWTHIENTGQLNATERDRTWDFVKNFILTFFGISKARFTENLATSEVSNERWMATTPGAGNTAAGLADVELTADELFVRPWYNLYCNHTILNFFYLLEILYRRLKDVKDCEKEAAEAVDRANRPKPATDIGLLDRRGPGDFFSPGSNELHYHTVLELLDGFIKNEVSEAEFQGYMRQFYLRKGWALYTVQDLMKQLCKLGSICAGNDSKDKTNEILRLFEANRVEEETSFNIEINFRKGVEKYIKDGDMFLIRYYTNQRRATVQLMSKNETTFDMDDMDRTQKWQYYVSSYVRVEPTEGVARPKQNSVVKIRNLPQSDTLSTSSTDENKRGPMVYDESLIFRICVNTYKLLYEKNTADWFGYTNGKGRLAAEKVEQLRIQRNDKFKEKFVMNNTWMRGMSQNQVENQNKRFDSWINEGNLTM